MTNVTARQVAEQLIETIARLLPEFLQDPADHGISGGNVALCIIDQDGQIYGRLFGAKPGVRHGTGKIAWQKASQVWLTGLATGRFEELVFTGQIDEGAYPLQRPDYIGWLGGMPLLLDGGERLAIAVSGMRGESDREIVVRAAAEVLGKPRDEIAAMMLATHPAPQWG